MGEVDDDPERLPGVDPLHPPRHERDRGQALADGRRIEADRLTEGHDRQRVVGVEPAHQLELRDGRAGRGVVRDPQASLVLLDARRPDVRGGIGAVREDPCAGFLGDADEGPGRRIVGVDDAGRGPAQRLGARPAGARAPMELLEQPQLGVAVGLPRAVELEVLVGQVGQDRDVVGDRIDPAERQAVRRRLDDRRGVAGDAHRLHRTLQVGCLGGRGVGLVGGLHAADPGRGGARHPGRDARGLERGHGEERGRRLAVRAGDPDDREGVARVLVPPGGGAGQGGPDVTDDQLRARATSGTGRSTSTAAAPARAAASTKSWPSTWSPGTATNSEPARTVRESLVTPLTVMSARPAGPIARPSRRAPRTRCSAASRSMSPPSCTEPVRSASARSWAIVRSVIG